MSPKSLLYHCQLKIYYQLYNILEFISHNAYWYCFCDRVPGCGQKQNSFYGWFLICVLETDPKYSTEYLDKIKKDLAKLKNFAKMLFNDLQELLDFDETIGQLWSYWEYSFKGRNHDGVGWEVDLGDIIECKFNRLYIF